MKILCVLESGTWITPHIVESLKESGHTVHTYSYGPAVGEFYGRGRARLRSEKNRDLLALATELSRGAGLDLIFCYVYDDLLLPETARAMARLDVPMVNYNVDMINQWYRQTRTAPFFTRMLCAQRENMRELARYNPRVLYFPMAGRKPAQPPPGSFRPGAEVTFVGTPMPYRAALLARLHRAAIPLAIYGKFWREGKQASAPAGLEKTLLDLWHYGWPKFRAEGFAGLLRAGKRRLPSASTASANGLPPQVFQGFVPEEALSDLFRQSAINLGFTRIVGDEPDLPGRTQIKLRDFEVPLAGGFYLVERVADYREMFEFGREVETWARPEELIEKARYYLGHPARREEIAAAGKRRAEAEHTWSKRFETLFEDLGIR